jgi:hypothetical protein
MATRGSKHGLELDPPYFHTSPFPFNPPDLLPVVHFDLAVIE